MGGLMKYLVVALVVGVGLWFWLARSRIGRQRARDKAGTTGGAGTSAGVPQAMVACAHCGVHLPSADAVMADGRAYCGQAHRALGPRA